MQESIQQAERALLHPAGLEVRSLQDAIGAAQCGLDWADIYVERRMGESWNLEDGIVKSGAYGDYSGIGLRAVCGDATAYVSSDAVAAEVLAHLRDAACAAKTQAGGQAVAHVAPPTCPPPRFGTAQPQAADAEKLALLAHADAVCRQDARVENVMASLAASHSVVLVARSDGGVAADFRPKVSFNLRVVMRSGKMRETGIAGCNGRSGFELLNKEKVTDLCHKALEDAAAKLEAVDAPAGRMPVVLGPGLAGVLLHEAVGHGLEGDFNRKRQSAFSGRVGEQVAARGVTVIDAGNIAARIGSLTVDDEGTPTSETVLIEDGILCGYMQDIINARLMKAPATGNGRRQSYAYPPMPRMTNTFMPGGNLAAEEIIASVEDGIYAEDFNGGEVDITNGNFVFVATKARRIRKGKLGEVLKGATLIGNGPAIMPLISMVGNDFSLVDPSGVCGKNGQRVLVGFGQPTVKVDEITVGGEAL